MISFRAASATRMVEERLRGLRPAPRHSGPDPLGYVEPS